MSGISVFALLSLSAHCSVKKRNGSIIADMKPNYLNKKLTGLLQWQVQIIE